MLDLALQYGLFLAKTVTVVVAVLIIVVAVLMAAARRRRHESGDIEVHKLNERYEQYHWALKEAVLDAKQLKAEHKAHKKSQGKKTEEASRKRIYLLNFHGDVRALAVHHLREEISAVLSLIRPEEDEVVLCLESPGGMVHGYGLAASQLQRLRNAGVTLTVCVDKVAASGGYMMACIANRILAAPFAVVGSIGVVAQIPNFNRLLKKHDIDVELHTAGAFKRTLTLFGENTDDGRRKFREELEDTHLLFKEFVAEHRQQVDMEQVGTGEHWYGRRALALGLVDELKTSDELLMEQVKTADVYAVRYYEKQGFADRFGFAIQGAMDRVVSSWWERLQQRY